MPQVWSATQINANITGGGTTSIAFNGVNNNWYPAFASEGVTSGKWYWETGISGFNNSSTFLVDGIGNTMSPTTTGDYIGSTADTVGLDSNSSFYNNGANIATWSIVIASGDRIGHALDLMNNLYWISDVTQATAWYGVISAGLMNTTGNPATGSNGYPIPSAVYANRVVPAAAMLNTGETIIGYFGASTWLGVAPSGFGPFDPVIPLARRQRRFVIPQVLRR